MSEDSFVAIIVAIISGLCLIMAGGIKVLWDMRGLKNQVQNDHSTGLRDDLDDKHDAQMAVMKSIYKQLVKSDRRQWKAINRQDAKIKALDKKK